MNRRVGSLSLLLFGSGFCALLYQTVWLRQFRLIFGASTAASAAVLAIFMAGLGIGGIVIGERVERSRNPLAIYGALEIGVAISAGLTPLLFFAVRAAYLSMGGSFGMPGFLVAPIRLLLAALVLAIPTTLMGGTLPAVARAAESPDDAERSGVAILYGMNTLGAVVGTLVSTFYLLEHFGNRFTLIGAALVNAFVGLTALLLSNKRRDADGFEAGETPAFPGTDETPARPAAIYAAAAIVGFAFLLMELVWYRLLTPLLGGTTFTFGLILAVALLGIGSGSFFYSIGRRRRATVSGFAICCALEAAFLAIPIALGDRVAVLALLLRNLGGIGFHGYVIGWSVIAGLAVFPAAFLSGLQFPLLISLLGTGRERVARHVGRAYAWNTLGAIAGSLAGGFGLLPLLTAPGVWRMVVVVLALLAMAASVMSRRARVPTFVISALSLAMLFAHGPTAFWRHTPIGAGRADQSNTSPNKLRDIEATRRRKTVWEADGVESSVSVADDEGYAFIVNGKGDGHARLDAGTQVMGGVLAGLLHPAPHRAAVIGLGTGTTAGWLGVLPTMEHVDVVEIEPAIVHVAEMCTAVNRNVLHNPKVSIVAGDGRELLLAKGAKYDIISSEPSNPYRAGIASLFTVEFYQACLNRLENGGVFIQFLQAYEVDAPTIRTAYATITSVFPYVETWQSQSGDLLLVGAREPLMYDAATLTSRLRNPVVAEGVWRVWWATDAAGVMAHFICGDSTARGLGNGSRRNTDDRTLIEYAFARTLGQGNVEAFRASDLRDLARMRADDLPRAVSDPATRAAVERRRMSIGIPDNSLVDLSRAPAGDLAMRGGAQNGYVTADYARTWTMWQAGSGMVETPLETLSYAESLANRGDEHAIEYIAALQRVAPIEAQALLARLRWRQGKAGDAAQALSAAFAAYRTNPWPLPVVMTRALRLVVEIADQPQARAVLPQLMDAISQPFAIHMFDEYRRSAQLLVADRIAGSGVCTETERKLIESYEPNFPWQHDYLRKRAECYQQAGDPRAKLAQRDWQEYLSNEPRRLTGELVNAP
ncbi:MAG: spermidine synthase [Thermoanaerobaculia bacterium]|nr:spermidine synthase [Thermoanaerobaculia bacterium]